MAGPLFRSTKAFLGRYLDSRNQRRLKEFYEGLLEKCYGICPELDQLLIEVVIQPLVKSSYKQDEATKEYSDTESSSDWRTNVRILAMTKIPYALEQAENLRLKFEK